jgi:hypothetical protein
VTSTGANLEGKQMTNVVEALRSNPEISFGLGVGLLAAGIVNAVMGNVIAAAILFGLLGVVL